jgi:hypothetical protein
MTSGTVLGDVYSTLLEWETRQIDHDLIDFLKVVFVYAGFAMTHISGGLGDIPGVARKGAWKRVGVEDAREILIALACLKTVEQASSITHNDNAADPDELCTLLNHLVPLSSWHRHLVALAAVFFERWDPAETNVKTWDESFLPCIILSGIQGSYVDVNGGLMRLHSLVARKGHTDGSLYDVMTILPDVKLKSSKPTDVFAHLGVASLLRASYTNIDRNFRDLPLRDLLEVLRATGSPLNLTNRTPL